MNKLVQTVLLQQPTTVVGTMPNNVYPVIASVQIHVSGKLERTLEDVADSKSPLFFRSVGAGAEAWGAASAIGPRPRGPPTRPHSYGGRQSVQSQIHKQRPAVLHIFFRNNAKQRVPGHCFCPNPCFWKVRANTGGRRWF